MIKEVCSFSRFLLQNTIFRSALITVLILIVASFCTSSAGDHLVKTCLRSEFGNNDLPQELQGWFSGFLAAKTRISADDKGRSSFTYLESSRETLFCSRSPSNTTHGTVYKANPSDAPIFMGTTSPNCNAKFVQSVVDLDEENEFVCFETAGEYFDFAHDIPLVFSTSRNDVRMERGTTSKKTFTSGIACYSSKKKALQQIPTVYQAADPIMFDGEVWFRGKGTKESPQLSETWKDARTFRFFFIYSYNLSTGKIRIRGASKCSRASSPWCEVPVRSNEKLLDLLGAAKERVDPTRRCLMIPKVIHAALLLVLTCMVCFLLYKKFTPEIFIWLSTQDLRIIARFGLQAVFALGRPTVVADVIFGCAMVMPRLLQTCCRGRWLGVVAWATSLLRVGVVILCNSALHIRSDFGIMTTVIAVCLMKYLHSLTAGEDVCMAAMGIILAYEAQHLGWSEWLLIAGFVWMVLSAWKIRSTLGYAMLSYSAGIWALLMHYFVLNHGVLFVSPISLALTVPLILVAVVLDEPTACKFSIFSVVLHSLLFLGMLIANVDRPLRVQIEIAKGIVATVVATWAITATRFLLQWYPTLAAHPKQFNQTILARLRRTDGGTPLVRNAEDLS